MSTTVSSWNRYVKCERLEHCRVVLVWKCRQAGESSWGTYVKCAQLIILYMCLISKIWNNGILINGNVKVYPRWKNCYKSVYPNVTKMYHSVLSVHGCKTRNVPRCLFTMFPLGCTLILWRSATSHPPPLAWVHIDMHRYWKHSIPATTVLQCRGVVQHTTVC
jgi:hypothetical protein